MRVDGQSWKTLIIRVKISDSSESFILGNGTGRRSSKTHGG